MDYLKAAMDWAKEHYSDASMLLKCAFANSVQYFMTGESGGYGGPSMREHLCSWSLAGDNGKVGTINVGGNAMSAIYRDKSLPIAGEWKFDEAIVHCSKLCFSPASEYRLKLIQIQEREDCFDDDPIDLEALRGKF